MDTFTKVIDRVLAHEGVGRPDAVTLKAALDHALALASFDHGQPPTSPANLRAYACAEPSCERQAYAGGLCNAHYLRQRLGRSMSLPVRSRKAGYACVECHQPQTSKGGLGRCPNHYRRFRRNILKAAVLEVYGGHCWSCAESYPSPVFDFHHLGAKTDSPSSLLDNASTQRIADELVHCVPLCANCHRMEHASV